MLFNTLEFGVFLLVVLMAYHRMTPRAQNRLLLAASYVFYGAWDLRFLGLLALTTGIDFLVARALGDEADPRRRKQLLGISLGANLGILGCFKYANFFLEGFFALLHRFGVEASRPVLEVVLPVGISFYTFQALSYTIDVYRGQMKPARRFEDFALFIAFFPQLVAGPIERASSLLPQVLGERRPTWEGMRSGCWWVLWGIYKKVVVADNLAFVADGVFESGARPTAAELLVATCAFTFQIYCDFSGYSDIAFGLARLFGFELTRNFVRPLFSHNPAEFWRRWHISLGRWVRDYVFLPLGGSRGSAARTGVNLMVMFLLIGLWHGASLAFLFWGFVVGLIVLAHRALRPWLARVQPGTGGGLRLWSLARRLAHGTILIPLFYLFRCQSFEQSLGLAATAFGDWSPGYAPDWLLPFAALVTPLLLCEIWQEWRGDDEVVRRAPYGVRVSIYAFLLLSIILLGEDNEVPFVYFQF